MTLLRTTRTHGTLSVAVTTLVVAPLIAASVMPEPATAQLSAPGPAVVVDPAELSAQQRPDQRLTHELTVGNTGDAELAWQVAPGSDEQLRLPTHPATPVDPVAPAPGGRGSLDTFPGHRGRPGWTVEPEAPPVPPEQRTFTHSESQKLIAGGALACSRNRGMRTAATSYLRHFTLADYSILGALDVTAVSFGVESMRGAAETLTVNLYTLVDPDGQFRYDNFAPLGTADVTVGSQSMSLVEVPVAGTVPAGATLVVEVAAPEMRRGGFYLGAHPGGQTAPSYLRAEACGMPEPAPTAELGAPETQLLLNVTGRAEVIRCELPADLPWLAADPLAGTVAPGGSQPVEVSFDSAGMVDGDVRSAYLCLDSNDPDRPRVEVPVTLTVAGPPCDETVTGVHPGPLTVTDGVTCLAPGAHVQGEVNVLDGAGLIATSAVIQGPLATFGATVVELTGSDVVGPVAVRGTGGSATIAGTQVVGSVLVVNNRTVDAPLVIAANTVIGSLFCTGNQPPPVDDGAPNTVVGGMKLDQCAAL